MSGDTGVINPLVRWSFYALVFSLAFEVGSGRELPFEVPTLLACIFLFIALIQPRACFRPPPRAFWWFAIYVWLYITLIILEGFEHVEMAYKRVFYLVVLLLLFWVAYNLMRHEQIARTTLFLFGVSCAVLTALHYLGFLSKALNPHAADRASVMGQNPANLAGILTVGLLALVGLTYGSNRSILRPRFLVWPLFAMIAFFIVSTGSRGPLLAFVAGLSVFILRRGNARLKLRNALIISAGVVMIIWFAFHSQSLQQRFGASLATGNLAGREQIFPAAWQMFLEKPLLGWGPVSKNFEIQRRARYPSVESRDPHNLILEVLTGTGLLGGIPILLGTWLCVRAAWKARFGAHGVLPLAMLVATFLINMSMDWLYSKTYWLTLAYALASGSPVLRKVIQRAAAAPSVRAGRLVLSSPRQREGPVLT
jgi:O-antigen ligase